MAWRMMVTPKGERRLSEHTLRKHDVQDSFLQKKRDRVAFSVSRTARACAATLQDWRQRCDGSFRLSAHAQRRVPKIVLPAWPLAAMEGMHPVVAVAVDSRAQAGRRCCPDDRASAACRSWGMASAAVHRRERTTGCRSA